MTDIVFDNQIFLNQSRGGVSRYFIELMNAIPEVAPDMTAEFPGRWTLNEHAYEAGLARPLPGLQILKKVERARRLGVHASRRALALRAPRKSALSNRDSVYHPTYYSKRRFLRTAGPVIVTVHDMIPEMLPELFRRNPHMDKDWYLDRADAIIAISESTAQDLRNLRPDLRTPIHVISHGVDAKAFKAIGATSEEFPRPWALFVGSRSGYKDFSVLLCALAEAPARSVHLVVASSRGATSEEMSTINRLGIAERVTFVAADDDRLAALYRSADVFVFPSRYEGFGLPTLEAMASGTPVILPSTSSHPEVGGDAGIYFSPGNSEELAERLAQITQDPTLREELHVRGISRAASFTWQRTAKLTAQVYRSVLR